VQGQVDLRVVRGNLQGAALLTAAAACGADVVVVSAKTRQPCGKSTPIWCELPGLSVFAFNADGAWACTYSFQPISTRLSEISGEQLLTALTSRRLTGTG
jgi:hypothetical protein